MLATALLLFKQFKTPILIGLCIAMAWAGAAYWGHTKYKAGYSEAHAEHMIERANWQREQAKWVAQVEQQKSELAEAVKAKELIVAKAVKDLDEAQKKVKVIYKEVDREVKATIRVSDVVRFPCIFGRLYNATIDGTGITEADKRSCEDPAGGPEAASKTTTLNAAYFAGVVIENTRAYNDLALQTNKLIDVVEELERIHNDSVGNDIGGNKGSP